MLPMDITVMDFKMIKHNFIKQQVSPNTISEIKVDASFRKIVKNSICFHVWRIEEDRLEAESKAQFGTFYDNGAYIIYAAAPVGGYVNQDTVTREAKKGTKIERFIHFWLGEKVSEQKRSNVAHKIQELDSYLGNVATEYRETQNHESSRFLSYFIHGISIRASALIGSKDPNRLYKLYGRKYLRCIEMESISWDYFCAEHICILKTAERFYLWLGRSSSIIERRAAFDVIAKFEKDSSHITVVDDGYEQQMPENCKKLWNSLLPLQVRSVVQAAPLPEMDRDTKMKIYKCCYRGQRLQLDQLDVMLPTQEDFNDSSAVYLLDGCQEGIWLWVGRQATQHENVNAMGNGRAFMKKKKYPYTTPLIRVVEGHEPFEFLRLFPSWYSDKSESTNGFKPVSTALGEIDSFVLCQRPKLAADAQLIDGGHGERVIYRITQEKVNEMPASKVTIFSTNCSYVIQYKISSTSSNPHALLSIGIVSITYQWNGSSASKETIDVATRFARSSFDKHLEKSMFVQMSEFDETPHFLQIFDGKLIILQNESNMNKAMSQRNGVSTKENENSHESIHNNYVLKVSGNASYNTKAVEVLPLTELNSKECYVFKTSHIWVWCGQGSTGDTREAAKSVGAALGESSLVLEGKEPMEFWRCIEHMHLKSSAMKNGLTNGGGSNNTISSSSHNNSNGFLINISNVYNRHGSVSPQNGNYINGYQNAKTNQRNPPNTQLFLVWMQQGRFVFQEIIGYKQSDLLPECIYILDANVVNYIWIGQHVMSTEKEKYLQFVQSYLETLPIARRPVSAVAVVRQQDEPNVFKGFFETWSYENWDNYVSYEQKRQLYMPSTTSMTNGKASSNGKTSPLQIALLNNQKDFDSHVKYSIAMLQQERDLLPDGINPLKRELHLTHDDFVSLFQMSFWEFDDLPGWKQQELKKKHKLF